jgi:excisionase family DNA binding protein
VTDSTVSRRGSGSGDASGLTTLLSVEEIAAWLQVPIATIYRWRSRGEGPPGYKIGKHVRFDRGEVLTWLAAQKDH